MIGKVLRNSTLEGMEFPDFKAEKLITEALKLPDTIKMTTTDKAHSDEITGTEYPPQLFILIRQFLARFCFLGKTERETVPRKIKK